MNVIDLFAGAGGLCTGLEQLGCQISLVVDNDRLSLETLSKNKPSKIKTLCTDLFEFKTGELRKTANLEGDDLLIVGGPPCQPFSKNSYWTEKGDDARYRRLRAQGIKTDAPAQLSNPRDDKRRFLIDVFSDAVRDAKPDGFIFENVASITHPRNRPLFERFLAKVQSYGYSINWIKANAIDFGVAQKRERVFVFGRRGNRRPEFSAPTHAIDPNGNSKLHPMRTAGQVLSEIPFENEKGIEISGRWADALREVPPGKNYKALTAWAGHPKPLFEAETKFWNFLLKLSPDLPSWTIASQPGPWTGPFHWENRRLTTPELAALQGFPAEYEFCGPRRERVRQIGNAVPPLFIAGLARGFIKELCS